MRPPRTWPITAGRSRGRASSELLRENGLPDIAEEDEDIARFGDLQYVSGILK